MLVFIVIGLTAFACNVGQGTCIFIDPRVMTGILTAGVVELMFEGMFGTLRVYRKKRHDDDDE